MNGGQLVEGRTDVSERSTKLVVLGVLLLHGVLGHTIVLVAHIVMSGRPERTESGWRAAQSWLLPSLASPAATALAVSLSALAVIGFAVAALAYRGILVSGRIWRQLAVASAIISIAGIVLFLGTWAPMANTLAALSVNVAVLVALLWLRWPPQNLFGEESGSTLTRTRND